MSWQARVLRSALGLTFKPVLTHTKSPDAVRARIDGAMMLSASPPPLTSILPATLGVAGRWVRAQGANPAQVILYFHGGAYVMGSSLTHSGVAGHLSALSGASVFLPDYRLAPEHPFPAAFNDAVASYDALLGKGYDPATIVLAGDSAGGGLALALLAHLCKRGPRPAGAMVYSPLTDLTFSGASLVTNSSREQVLAPTRLTEVRAHILGGAKPGEANDPRLSPLHASFPAPPPVQIHAAETEILRDDSLRMRSRLPDAEIKLAGDLPHVWPLFHTVLPEARETLRQSGAFIRSCLTPSVTGN